MRRVRTMLCLGFYLLVFLAAIAAGVSLFKLIMDDKDASRLWYAVAFGTAVLALAVNLTSSGPCNARQRPIQL